MNLYCISFPNGKRYFGVETRTGNRWRSHKSSARRGSGMIVHKAIRKYGIDNCSFIYIYRDMPKEYILRLEIEFIRSYDTTNIKNGYNVSPGGDHWTPNESTKSKLSARTKAYYAAMTAEELEIRHDKVRRANIGRKHTPETCAKFRENSLKQRPRSPEYLKMLSDRKKVWWAARKSQGITGAIAYTKNPHLKPEPKTNPREGLRLGQHIAPPTEEHRRKIAEKKRLWWIARRASGLPLAMRNLKKV